MRIDIDIPMRKNEKKKNHLFSFLHEQNYINPINILYIRLPNLICFIAPKYFTFEFNKSFWLQIKILFSIPSLRWNFNFHFYYVAQKKNEIPTKIICFIYLHKRILTFISLENFRVRY